MDKVYTLKAADIVIKPAFHSAVQFQFQLKMAS